MVAVLEMVELESNLMALEFTKAQALSFYCLARQAERSIARVLSPSCPCEPLREYYSESRLNQLEEAANSLRDFSAPSISRYRMSEGAVWRVLTVGFGRLLNRFRSTWRFSLLEVQFLSQTLRAAVEFLRLPEKPHSEQLINLRMDLYACQWVIAGK